MAIITWQNVTAPDLSSSQLGLRTAADLINKGLENSRGITQEFTAMDAAQKASDQQLTDRLLTQEAMQAKTPEELQKLTATGLMSKVPQVSITPETLRARDMRLDLLGDRNEKAYQRDMERLDNAAIPDTLLGASQAQDPDKAYGQAAIKNAKFGTVKGATEAIKAISDAYHQQPRGGGSGSGSSKVMDLEAQARGWAISERMGNNGDNQSFVEPYKAAANDPLAQKWAYHFASQKYPDQINKWLNPYGLAGGPPGTGSGSGGFGHGGQGQGAQGASGQPGGSIFDMSIPGVPGAPQVDGPALPKPFSASGVIGKGLGIRYGSTLRDVQTDFPNAPPPPGHDWDGNPTNEPTTQGAIYDWNEKYALASTKSRRYGNKQGDTQSDPLGTTATSPYQITNETRAQYAEKVFGPDWRNAPGTMEVEDKIAEAIYNDRGTEPWKALHKYGDAFEKKSFREMAPLIKYLEGGEIPDNYKKDIADIRQNLVERVATDDLTKIALTANQKPLENVDGAVTSVAKALKDQGTEKVSPGNIKSTFDKMDEWAKEYGVKLSLAEKAGLLQASLKESRWWNVDDVADGWDTDDTKLENSIKDFGRAQATAKDVLTKADQSLTRLTQLSGRYTDTAKDALRELKLANQKGATKSLIAGVPNKFATVAQISEEMKGILQSLTKPASVAPSPRDVVAGVKKAATTTESQPTDADIQRRLQSPAPDGLLAPKTEAELAAVKANEAKRVELQTQIAKLENNPKIHEEGSPEERVYLRLKQELETAQLQAGRDRVFSAIGRFFRPNEPAEVAKAREALVLAGLNTPQDPNDYVSPETGRRTLRMPEMDVPPSYDFLDGNRQVIRLPEMNVPANYDFLNGRREVIKVPEMKIAPSFSLEDFMKFEEGSAPTRAAFHKDLKEAIAAKSRGHRRNEDEE